MRPEGNVNNPGAGSIRGRRLERPRAGRYSRRRPVRIRSTVEHFLTDIVARHGYIAVLLLMAASTACIPVPSEVVLLFGGALASSTFAQTALAGGAKHLDLAWIIAVATIGTLVGAWAAYGIGAIGGRRLVDRAGKYLLFRPDEV